MALLRPQIFQPRLPEIGRIYKGSKKTPSAPGKDLDYFRFEPNPAAFDMARSDGKEGNLAQQLIESWQELGDSPRNISIRFLHDTITEVFPCSNEVWKEVGGKSRCTNRCDGKTQLLHLEDKNGKKVISKDPSPCHAVDGENDCPIGCKPTGRLLFVLPDLKYPGKIVLTTHSINDILEIQGNLGIWESRNLSKIPFRLCRTKRNVRYELNGVAKDMDRWLCHIQIDPSFGSQILDSQPRQYLAQLESGVEISDAEIIEDSPLSLPPSPSRDWSRIAKELNISTSSLKSIAEDAGLPSKSSDLSPDQSTQLFNECLIFWVQSFEKSKNQQIFSHPNHMWNSLIKAQSEFPDDIDLINAWRSKAEEKLSKKLLEVA